MHIITSTHILYFNVVSLSILCLAFSSCLCGKHHGLWQISFTSGTLWPHGPGHDDGGSKCACQYTCLCVAVGTRTSSLVCIHLDSNVRPFMCERATETTLGGSWQEVTVLTSGPPKLPSKHTSTIKAVNNNHKCPVQVCFSPP